MVYETVILLTNGKARMYSSINDKVKIKFYRNDMYAETH